jgi:hypothetical protein
MTSFSRPRQPGASLAQKATPRNTRFEPIPEDYAANRNPPYHMTLGDILSAAEVKEITDAGSMAFHCIGDTGGVKDPQPQQLVERGMEMSLKSGSLAPTLRGAAMAPAFCYHLGDVVYYNGEIAEYSGQFYQPYENYPLPIVAIPGNHDGEPMADGSTSTLDGFYRNFLAVPGPEGKRVFTPESHDSGRAAMNLPFFYWTLITPYATFIGLYSNVPEHGRFDDKQRAWFHSEMAAASRDRALIVSVHHPIFSFDTFHSGSSTMAKELEDAINISGRLPNMVLSAHVHNYQRIERVLDGHTIPFFVIGNGGYWNLHHLAAAPGYKDPQTEAELMAGIDSRHGFMTFEISDSVINGHMTTVPRPQESWTDANAYNATFDVFNYTSTPLFLSRGAQVALVPPDGTQVPPHTDHTQIDPPARSAKAQQTVAARNAHAARTAARASGTH